MSYPIVIHVAPTGRNAGYAPTSAALAQGLMTEIKPDREFLGNAQSLFGSETEEANPYVGRQVVFATAGNLDDAARDSVLELETKAKEFDMSYSFLYASSQIRDDDLTFTKDHQMTLVVSEAALTSVSAEVRANFAEQMVVVDMLPAVGTMPGDSYKMWKEQVPGTAAAMLKGIQENGNLIVVQPPGHITYKGGEKPVPLIVDDADIIGLADIIANNAPGGTPVLIIPGDCDKTAAESLLTLDEGVSPVVNPTTAKAQLLFNELMKRGVNFAFVNKPGFYQGNEEDKIQPWNVFEGLLQEGNPENGVTALIDGVADTSVSVVNQIVWDASEENDMPLHIITLDASNNNQSPPHAQKAEELYERFGASYGLASGTLSEMLGDYPMTATRPSETHLEAARAHITRFGLNA